MKKTKTRFFVERHNITFVRAVHGKTQRLASQYSNEARTIPLVTTPRRETEMAKRFSIALTVPLGVILWIVGAVLVDLLVQQIYPVPKELFSHGTMLEIIASRPTAATASTETILKLNVRPAPEIA
jgi:hypothetical protein